MADTTVRRTSSPPRSPLRGLVAAVALVVIASACGGGGSGDANRTNKAAPTRPTTAAPPTTQAPSTTLPTVAAVPRPDIAPDDGYSWFVHPSVGEPRVLLAVRRSLQPKRHPAVLLADSSGGLNLDYLPFADDLLARGFDVAVGCLYNAPEPLAPETRRVPCVSAPQFDGAVDSMVGTLDELVDATYGALGSSTPLAVMGFSRGAGIAALRATRGRREPVVLASGRYEGWGATPGGPGVVNTADLVAGWRAPALIVHGTIDAAVPVGQSMTLESALRAVGVSVDSHYYEGSGHNLAGEPGVGEDLENRTAQFLCAHLACPA